jgi:hypothetical protein
MGDKSWTETVDRVGHGIWQLLRDNPEVNYVRAEVQVADVPVVLDGDPVGGVTWVDESEAGDHRQVVLPDGQLARKP